MKKDRASILADHPIDVFLERRGIILKGSGRQRTTNRCPSEEHKPLHQCVSIDCEKGLWKCHACDQGGTVIDFLTLSTGCSVGDAMRELAGEEDSPFAANGCLAAGRAPQSTSAQRQTAPAEPKRLVKTYDYTEANGNLLYQVCRYEPKTFRQRRPTQDGGWNWDMKGQRLVLYNLPRIKTAEFVWIVEGEKDADSLNALGASFTATCNVAGAGKWLDSYTQTLKGKEIVLCGDNDEPGQKHMAKIQEAMAGVAKTVRVIHPPDEFKDITEYIATFSTPQEAGVAIFDLAEAAEVLAGGVRVPVRSLAEMEKDYEAFTKKSLQASLSLGKWLPLFGHSIRPLVPGELVTIIADTGVGKTMILQNLALNTSLVTLLFEMELPDTLTFERFVGIATKHSGREVSDKYREGEKIPWKEQNLNHIHVCSESRLTIQGMEEIINKTGLKLGHRPQLVLVDYIQLAQGAGGSRYEKLSSVAEEMKILAKSTNTIVVVASQVARKEKKQEGKAVVHEVSLHDAKDSGSIENSSGLVLGAWRDAADGRNQLWLKVCKNTKGISGAKTACRIGSDLTLVEMPSMYAPGI